MQLTSDGESHGVERLLVPSEPCGTRVSAPRGRGRPRPPGPAHSRRTTTAALVDTCPCTLVATAEYVAVSSKFALGREHARTGPQCGAGPAAAVSDPNVTPALLESSPRDPAPRSRGRRRGDPAPRLRERPAAPLRAKVTPLRAPSHPRGSRGGGQGAAPRASTSRRLSSTSLPARQAPARRFCPGPPGTAPSPTRGGTAPA